MPADIHPAPTFARLVVRNTPAIRCLLCDAVSVHPSDLLYRYCGRCHLFHDLVGQGRRLLAAGGTHDCAEWRTGRGACALCGRVALEDR